MEKSILDIMINKNEFPIIFIGCWKNFGKNLIRQISMVI